MRPFLIMGGLAAAMAVGWTMLAMAASLGPVAAVGAIALGTHLAAIGLGWRGGKPGPATWLIAGGQLIGMVAVALILKDAWILGLFLLAIVPLEIALADHPKRIPLAAILALLGAASMVGIELLDPAGRLLSIAEQPTAFIPAASLFALHAGALGLLLWHLRLRSGAGHHVRLELATQLPLVLTGISVVSILVVSGVLMTQIRAAQIGEVGRTFQTLADIQAERVGNSLDEAIEALILLGRRSTSILDGLAAANGDYPASEADRQAVLAERAARWQSEPDASDFVLRYRSSDLALELSRFRGEDLLHSNVLLTDREGGLLAVQGARPSTFDFGDLPWWRAAWDDAQGGVYLGDLMIDPQTRETSVFIAVGVLDPATNGTVGVLSSTYALSGISRDIALANDQLDATVALLSQDDQLIAGPAGTENDTPTPAGAATDDTVQARSPLTATGVVHRDALRSLGWSISVSDSQANALAEVTRSTEVATLVGLLAIALGVMAAMAAARPITRPIEGLTATAASIAAGDLDQRASPEGPVELRTLAEAFNTLTARLRSLISGLQHEVAQRTGQLQARVEQLATLNRITQTVSSVRDLGTAPRVVTGELAELFDATYSWIALLDNRQDLRTAAVHARRGADLDEDDLTSLLAAHPTSAQASASGRPLLASGPATSEPSRMTELAAALRSSDLMIVALQSRGELIGTLGVAATQPDREFTGNEVALAETVAGQIASAVENSRLFAEMQEAKESAVAANDAKSAFLTNVSHELRTPLTSVVGFAKIIRRRLEERVFPLLTDDDPRAVRAVEQIRANVDIIVAEGERLTTLINNVLDLAKIEAGKVEWTMEPLQVDAILDRAIAATSSLLEEKRLTLTREVADDLPEVLGDRDSLIQVVINLLSNAVKFTDAGGVTCQVRVDGPNIVVSVIDTGMGIAVTEQPRVFEQFAQVGDTLTGKPYGTGLGLPICRQIVERHGGQIWVSSQLGAGSNFSFSLPVLDDLDEGPGAGEAGTARVAANPASAAG